MTATATEAGLIPVGTKVRVTQLWGGGSVDVKVGDLGTVERHNAQCCGGEHKYVIRTDSGREFAVQDVERFDPETPFAVGDRVRLLREIGGDARVGDLGTVTDVTPGTVFARFDGRTSGARGGGIHAITQRQVDSGDYLALVERGSKPPEAEDVQAKIDAALADYKERVKSVAMDYARKNDWCGEVTRALEDMGIDMTPESDRVRLTIDVTYEPSSSEAEDGIDYAYFAEQAIRRYVGDYMDGSVTIDSTDALAL